MHTLIELKCCDPRIAEATNVGTMKQGFTVLYQMVHIGGQRAAVGRVGVVVEEGVVKIPPFVVIQKWNDQLKLPEKFPHLYCTQKTKWITLTMIIYSIHEWMVKLSTKANSVIQFDLLQQHSELAKTFFYLHPSHSIYVWFHTHLLTLTPLSSLVILFAISGLYRVP